MTGLRQNKCSRAHPLCAYLLQFPTRGSADGCGSWQRMEQSLVLPEKSVLRDWNGEIGRCKRRSSPQLTPQRVLVPPNCDGGDADYFRRMAQSPSAVGCYPFAGRGALNALRFRPDRSRENSHICAEREADRVDQI